MSCNTSLELGNHANTWARFVDIISTNKKYWQLSLVFRTPSFLVAVLRIREYFHHFLCKLKVLCGWGNQRGSSFLKALKTAPHTFSVWNSSFPCPSKDYTYSAIWGLVNLFLFVYNMFIETGTQTLFALLFK